MATTSPDNIRTPNPNDNFNLIADWATTASDVQAALVKRANMYVGTSAQRVAFSSAPEGTHWQDTDGDKIHYVRQSGAWVNLSPDTGWVNLSTSLVTTYRGVLMGRKEGAQVELLYTAPPSTSFGNGSFVTVGTLPAEWRPSGSQNRRGVCWFTGVNLGVGYVVPGTGAVGVVQSTGASRQGAEANWSYTA